MPEDRYGNGPISFYFSLQIGINLKYSVIPCTNLNYLTNAY